MLIFFGLVDIRCELFSVWIVIGSDERCVLCDVFWNIFISACCYVCVCACVYLARRTLSSTKALGSVVMSFFTCGKKTEDSAQNDMLKSLAEDVKWNILIEGTITEMAYKKVCARGSIILLDLDSRHFFTVKEFYIKFTWHFHSHHMHSCFSLFLSNIVFI